MSVCPSCGYCPCCGRANHTWTGGLNGLGAYGGCGLGASSANAQSGEVNVG